MENVKNDSLRDLTGRRVLLGICGGIAAYKIASLTSLLVKSGVETTVVMTENATKLVGSKTFEALTRRPVAVDMWEARMIHPHIELARQAELFCIAPATADILAKAAMGLADDLLSATILAFGGDVLFAPAMNSIMWSKPAVKRNVEQIRKDGGIIIGPTEGRLSCGESGAGRMVEPEEIYSKIANILERAKIKG